MAGTEAHGALHAARRSRLCCLCAGPGRLATCMAKAYGCLPRGPVWKGRASIHSRRCVPVACARVQAIGRLAKAAAALHDAEGTEAANKERAAVDKRIKDAEADKVAPLMAEVEKASPRVAGQVRDLIAKVGGLRDKAVRLLADKVELVKKGTTPLVSVRRRGSDCGGSRRMHAAPTSWCSGAGPFVRMHGMRSRIVAAWRCGHGCSSYGPQAWQALIGTAAGSA